MVLGLESFGELPPELQTIALTMYALFGLCGALVAFIFIIWWGTRGWLKPLVKAKLSGKSLLLQLSRDKKLKLEAVENIAGMYKGKAGEYMINLESVYHNPAGVPTSIGYEHAGATLNPKHIFFLQKVLSEGIPVSELVRGKDGKPIEDEKGNQQVREYVKKIENIEELEEFSKDFKKRTGDDFVINYQGETLRIQDILNFFKYDTNPSLMEAKIENKLARERMEERKLPLKWIMVMIPLIMTLVIAFMILTNFINAQGSVTQLNECYNRLAPCLAAQKIVTQPITGGVVGGGEMGLT